MSKGIMICVLGAARTGSRFVRRVLAEAFDAAQVPWDANYVWMRGARGPSDLRGEDEATPALGRHFDRCLRSIAGSTTGAVIEKTVSNSIRPGFVRRALPAARLVALFRSPSAVIRSSARCWAGEVTATDARRKFVSILRWNPGFLTDRILERVRRTPRIWGVRYPGIQEDLLHLSTDEVCAKQWAWSVRSTANWIAANPEACEAVLFHEDLSHPGAVQAALEPMDPQAARRGEVFARSASKPTPTVAPPDGLSSSVVGDVQDAITVLRSLNCLTDEQRVRVERWSLEYSQNGESG